MNKLFERIGITQGPWESYERYGCVDSKSAPVNYKVCKKPMYNNDHWKANARLISQAPAMLEALIEYCYSSYVFESNLIKHGLDIRHDSLRYNKIIPIIESATDMKWTEIKSILEE